VSEVSLVAHAISFYLLTTIYIKAQNQEMKIIIMLISWLFLWTKAQSTPSSSLIPDFVVIFGLDLALKVLNLSDYIFVLI
jgi:hypothetical protein